MALVVKNLPANAGDKRDTGSTTGLGRSLGGGAGQPTPVFLPGESSWTKEPGVLQFIGLQTIGHDWSNFSMHASMQGEEKIYNL